MKNKTAVKTLILAFALSLFIFFVGVQNSFGGEAVILEDNQPNEEIIIEYIKKETDSPFRIRIQNLSKKVLSNKTKIETLKIKLIKSENVKNKRKLLKSIAKIEALNKKNTRNLIKLIEVKEYNKLHVIRYIAVLSKTLEISHLIEKLLVQIQKNINE